MVSVGDVGVDDGCEAEAGDDDAEAGDCLGEADGGWHDGVVGVYIQLRLVTQLPGWRPQDAGRAALSPHSLTLNTAQYCDLTITPSHHHHNHHTITPLHHQTKTPSQPASPSHQHFGKLEY